MAPMEGLYAGENRLEILKSVPGYFPITTTNPSSTSE